MKTSNETHNTVILAIPGGTYSVQLKGTSVVPEFDLTLIMGALAITALVTFNFISWRFRLFKV